MGRQGLGIEVRAKSIRFTFLPGKPTLMLNGEPMPPTKGNIQYAQRLAAEIRDRIRYGTFSMSEYFPANGVSGQLTVASQLKTWLGAQRIEHSTKAGYSSAIKFWEPLIGDKALRALKHSDVLTALATRPDLSGKTVNNYVSVLREALALAVTDKILPSNPVDGVPRAKHQKEPPDPFSREEAEAIIADAAKHYPEPIYNMIDWRFFCGVRTSEAFGIHWGSVDLASDYMQIREAVVRGIEKNTTKTAVARDVILNSRAKAALTRQAKHTRMLGKHVWLDPRYGTPWTEERAFRRSYWEPMLKRLGIRYRPPNNMRHTYATMMLMAGMTPAFCAGQMGHSVEMFLRTYAKWLNGGQNALEMQRLEATLSSPVLPQEMKTPG